jgi:hypothetical protein
MPNPCYSYPAEPPPESASRGAARAAPRDPRKMGYPCFSYPLMCFSYPSMCFSYPGDVPLDAIGRDAEPPPLRRMPFGTCFRY